MRRYRSPGALTAAAPRPTYAPNVVRNQKYTVLNFVFLVLLEQFSYFFNVYFLLVALSQLIPVLRTGTPPARLVAARKPLTRHRSPSPGPRARAVQATSSPSLRHWALFCR